MEISGITSPNEILERLEQLQIWQEEQKNQLVQKQLAQRHQLQLEQQKLCQMFGLSGSITLNNESTINSSTSRSASCIDDTAATAAAGSLISDSIIYRNQSNQNEEKIIEISDLKIGSIEKNIPSTEVNNKYPQISETISLPSPPHSPTIPSDGNIQENDEPVVIKRKFLRRGEGLKNRFNINPDSLQLKNLPSYKFANIHRNRKFTEKSRQKCPKQRPPNDVLCLKKSNNKKIPIVDQVIQPNDSIGSFLREEEAANQQETPQKIVKPTPGHVYFADEVIINELPEVEFNDDDDDDDEIDTDDDLMDSDNELLTSDFVINKTSTPNTKSVILQSKPLSRNLLNQNMMKKLGATDQKPLTITDPTLSINDCDNLKEKLKILENEIQMYRDKNAELTQSKQMHELEKLKFEEERNEFDEKMEDERIKLEVYLHDERIKLANERTTLERRLKESKGPNRKEREDMTKLKEQVNNLESDLLTKQQQHIAAQARLRAKLRTIEKDFKDLSIEMEALKKENKKCEQENIRLRRQGNNKILNEINRNIAKLGNGAATNSSVSEVVVVGDNSESLKYDQQKIGKNLIKSKSIDGAAGKNITTRISQSINQDDSIDNDNYKGNSNEPGDEIDKEKRFFSDDQYNQNKMENNNEIISIEQQVQPEQSEATGSLKKQMQQQTWKREVQNEDGSKDYWYPNGNIKKISADSMITRMLYYNKDIKDTNLIEGTIKYYYAESNTWQTTYLDGLEIFEFPNGQTEHRYKDGKIEIHFPNGLVRISTPKSDDTIEQWTYPNGQQMIQKRNGEKILIFTNGQREIHTETHKRREYPDGTVKFLYLDGSQETRYSNGRIRLKDNAGNLVMDSENLFVEK